MTMATSVPGSPTSSPVSSLASRTSFPSPSASSSSSSSSSSSACSATSNATTTIVEPEPELEDEPLDPRLYLQLVLHGTDIVALLDTSASYSYLSDQVAAILTEPGRDLTGGPGNNGRIRGQITTVLSFDDATFQHDFIVISEVQHDCILGVDFCRKFRLQVNLEKGTYRLGPEGRWLEFMRRNLIHNTSSSQKESKLTDRQRREDKVDPGDEGERGSSKQAAQKPSRKEQRSVTAKLRPKIEPESSPELDQTPPRRVPVVDHDAETEHELTPPRETSSNQSNRRTLSPISAPGVWGRIAPAMSRPSTSTGGFKPPRSVPRVAQSQPQPQQHKYTNSPRVPARPAGPPPEYQHQARKQRWISAKKQAARDHKRSRWCELCQKDGHNLDDCWYYKPRDKFQPKKPNYCHVCNAILGTNDDCPYCRVMK